MNKNLQIFLVVALCTIHISFIVCPTILTSTAYIYPFDNDDQTYYVNSTDVLTEL